MALENVAEHRSGKGCQRDVSVPYRPFGGDAKEKQPQYRAISVTGQYVDGIDDARAAHHIEEVYDQPHDDSHADVHAMAYASRLLFGSVAVCLEDVQRERSGQSRQSRTGCGESRRHQSQNKKDTDNRRKIATRGQEREKFITFGRMGDAVAVGIGIEQGAEHEEECYDEKLHHATGEDVLLRIAVVPTAQIALHHVLIQTRHSYYGEYARQKLLEEIASVVHVIEEKHTGVVAPTDKIGKPTPLVAQVGRNIDDAEYDRDDEAEGLERICPDQRFHSALERIQPDEEHRQTHIGPKRTTERFEYDQLERQAHEEETDSRTEHLGNEEKPCPRLVGRKSEPLLQVAVNGHQIHPVEERDQHESNDQLSGHEAQYHLQVGESTAGHHARHGYEGHTRYTGADHGKSHHVPRGFAIADEEAGIIRLAARDDGNTEKENEIDDNGQNSYERTHIKSLRR